MYPNSIQSSSNSSILASPYSLSKDSKRVITITYSTKSYTYVLPDSYDEHIDEDLLKKLEVECDYNKGPFHTYFYVTEPYSPEAVSNKLMGRISYTPVTIRVLDACRLIESKDEEGFAKFLKSQPNKEELFKILNITHPVLVTYIEDHNRYAIIDLCKYIIKFESLFTPRTISSLFNFIKQRGYTLYFVEKYYMARAADLASPEFDLYIPILQEKMKNVCSWLFIKERMIDQIAQNVSLQNVKIIFGEEVYHSNARYLKLFGGEFVNKTLEFDLKLDKPLEIDLTTLACEHPAIFELVYREILGIPQTNYTRDLVGSGLCNLHLLDEYEFLGLDFASKLNDEQKEIFQAFVQRDFPKLLLLLRKNKFEFQVIHFCRAIKRLLMKSPAEIIHWIDLIQELKIEWNRFHFFDGNTDFIVDATLAGVGILLSNQAEMTYLALHGLNVSRINLNFIPILQKLCHLGRYGDYSDQEIEEVTHCNKALSFLLNLSNDLNFTTVSHQITAFIAIRLRTILASSPKKSEDISFLKKLEENKHLLFNANGSLLNSEDFHVIEYLMNLSTSLRMVCFPFNESGENNKRWIDGIEKIEKKGVLLRLVMNKLPSCETRHFIFSRSITLPLNGYYYGLGDEVNTTYASHHAGHPKVSNLLSLHNYYVTFFETHVVNESLSFDFCELNQVFIRGVACKNLNLTHCHGDFRLKTDKLLDRIKIKECNFSEQSLISLAQSCKQLSVDLLPPLMPKAWDIIKPKLYYHSEY